jgi:hypothetical protein
LSYILPSHLVWFALPGSGNCFFFGNQVKDEMEDIPRMLLIIEWKEKRVKVNQGGELSLSRCLIYLVDWFIALSNIDVGGRVAIGMVFQRLAGRDVNAITFEIRQNTL